MSKDFWPWVADMNGRIPYDANRHLYKIKLFDVDYAQWGVVRDAIQPAIEKAMAWLKSVKAAGLHVSVLELDGQNDLVVEIDMYGNVAFFIVQRDGSVSRIVWSSRDWDVTKADTDNYHYAKDRQANIPKYREVCWLVVLYKWNAFKKAVSEAMMEEHPELLDIMGAIEHFDDEQQKTSASE